MSDGAVGRCIGLIGGLGVGATGDKAGLAEYLAGLIGRLASAGAGFAAIPAVTPHICIAELLKISRLPIVNPVEELQREIETRGWRRVALFGTRFTVESRLFGLLRGVEVVTPEADEADFIHQTYMQLVGSGAGLEDQREELSRVAHRLIEREGAQAVILAGTELALVFNESNTDFPHADCARLHIDAIVRRAVD